MLRGSSKRSYRTRSRKRRRYSSRRRTYRSYRRKRSRLSLDERMRIVAVKNATTSKKQYGWIARDLGSLVPDCLSVKLFQKFTWSEAGRSDVGMSNTGQNFYQYSLKAYPVDGFGGFGVSPWMSIPVYYSDPAKKPVGWARLVGSTQAALYRRACCISAAYDIRVHIVPLVNNNTPYDSAASDNGLERTFPPWRHWMCHQTQGAGTPLTLSVPNDLNVDTFDNVLAQPGMHLQHTRGLANGVPNQQTGALAASSWMVADTRTCRWRTVIWPHKVLDRPFTQYIGDHGQNWGTGTALPTAYANVCIGGVAVGIKPHSGGSIYTGLETSTFYTSHRVTYEIDVCYSMLCKTPNVGLI